MQDRRQDVRVYRFPSRSRPHIAFIKDRPRNSGLTSLRFVGANRFVCCDFNEKLMYLAELDGTALRIIAQTPTIIQDGTPVETDLLDVNDQGLLVVSNFYQGTQSFYVLGRDTLSFASELKLTNFLRCHGVRFVPGYPDLLWVSYCGAMNKCIVILDFRNNRILHTLELPEQMQDAAFIGPYVLAPARTNHITVGSPYAGRMYATVYLFQLPANLYETPPQVVDVWQGEGHLDAMKEYGAAAYSANQYTDMVDVFGVTAQGRLERRPSLRGFSMPHGLDIRDDGLLGVTNYGDNSMRFLQLPPVQRQRQADVDSRTQIGAG